MRQEYFAKTRKILQRSFCSRFYERLSLFCYSKLRENYLSASRRIIFLFLLMLCAEITFSLGAPVSRSVRINFPYAITLDITEYSPKLFFLGKNFTHKATPFFVGALRYSSLVPQAHTNNHVIPASVRTLISTLFVSLTKLLIRDDRIIAAFDIKISPIKAQGPPFFEHLFTVSYFVSSPLQYLYYCVISIIVSKESHSFFVGILAIFTTLRLQFLKLKIAHFIHRYFKFFIFTNWLRVFIFAPFAFLWFSKIKFKKEVEKNNFDFRWEMHNTAGIGEVMVGVY